MHAPLTHSSDESEQVVVQEVKHPPLWHTFPAPHCAVVVHAATHLPRLQLCEPVQVIASAVQVCDAVAHLSRVQALPSPGQSGSASQPASGVNRMVKSNWHVPSPDPVMELVAD
jgi:hypothetical protein